MEEPCFYDGAKEPVEKPNKTTLAAIKAANEVKVKSFQNVAELIADLEKNDD